MTTDKNCETEDDNSLKNIKDEIKEEGECSEDEEKSKDLKKTNISSLGDSRFILEETTGMYYDQVTGYYYNLVSLIHIVSIVHINLYKCNF